ncbi:unnamed protein product [Staurois parvus]|uniref:Uncharacterized protein n=1 Tax=Staurois parvus TaxID=386267 RepID=A0ABN9CJK4_9NEOB|nr:unnamed protein product [Staurois parvus]
MVELDGLLSFFSQTRGRLTIGELGHCPRAQVSRGTHEMSMVPFIGFFGCDLSVGEDTGAHDPLLPGGPMR